MGCSSMSCLQSQMLLNTSPHRNWRDGVLADQAETLLVFSGSRIFHPEQAVLFNAFAESRRFDGRQAVVHVVKEMFIEAELTAHRVEQFRREVEVFSVDHSCSSGQAPLVAGSYASPFPFAMP